MSTIKDGLTRVLSTNGTVTAGTGTQGATCGHARTIAGTIHQCQLGIGHTDTLHLASTGQKWYSGPAPDPSLTVYP